MAKKYNIGLDIGTTSVGYAVVEADNYKIMKKGRDRKPLWGVRLFDEASTAEATRIFRSTRRKYDRRRYRIKLLQDEFMGDINKVDKSFYKKLKESKYHENDKLNKTIILSKEENKRIKEYNDKYKTIYHLRNRLITDPSKEDIRLVYLAIHHIIKYRGNFLYQNDSFFANGLNLCEKLTDVFNSIIELIPNMNIVEDYCEIIDINILADILVKSSKNDIKIDVKELLSNVSDNKNFGSEFAKLVVGNKFSIKKLLMLDDIDNDIIISFEECDYEDKYSEVETLLGDKIEIIDVLKEIYDTIFLKKLFKNSTNISISSLMVERYNTHKKDLRFLKQIFDKKRDLYNRLFKSQNDICLYEKYIHNKISYDDFIKEVGKLFKSINDVNITNDIIFRMENGSFLPRITDVENCKYPYQLNKEELIKIIESQGKYYPFLLDKVGDKYKIVKILEFRIPYYVGPLVSDNKSRFAWMERKINNVKITPYNFDDVVDKEKTAEKFIRRMISHCTYLLDEEALPNNSILYSRYKVMNELKQIRVNGNKLSNEIQHKIMNELFMQNSGSITDTKFKQYLYSLPVFAMYDGDINVTGYSADKRFANDMKVYCDFFLENGIFNNTSYTEEDADEIISWVTIFDDKDILRKKIEEKYINLNEIKIKKILNKKYSGWGSLSKKLLTGLTINDKKTHLQKSILDLMYETEENFMQIINNNEYNFQDLIRRNNIFRASNKITYDVVEKLAASPATKRGIYQALKVVQELIKYIGYDPENIVIEMSRGEDIKKARKDDRKQYLIKLYEASRETIEEYNELYEELESQEKIDSQKLFLYFIQEGKCLYSGKKLNIEDLDSYEIDHIIPRTLIKDDSIDNKALVYGECNQIKAASFVLPLQYRTNVNKAWWEHLKKIGLISPKKFYRLTRSEYKDEDIEGFINRQLVETRQITKHVVNIISNYYKNTNVIYLKASLSHNYRQRYEIYKFRDINDYHHAHDAYLAAVLGYYKEKYMKRNINYDMVCELNNRLKVLGNYKELRYGFVINSLDDNVSYIVNEISNNLIDEETGEVLFNAREFNKIVENTLYRNDILISKKTEIRSGKFFKESILPRKKGNVMLKKNMPTGLYGGYSNVETSYLNLVEYNNKRKLIGIPLEIVAKSKNDNNIKRFICEQLNLDDESKFNVLKYKVPYEVLINYKNHDVYIKGYSVSNKNCELSNAYQLKISKNNIKKWKYVLNKILNNVSIPKSDGLPIINEDIMIEQCIDIINYLFNQKVNFPLFKREIENIENNINIYSMNFYELSKIITELFKLYHCNSVNANLKEFGLGNRLGRLSGNNITTGTLKFKSVTGIKEEIYKF